MVNSRRTWIGVAACALGATALTVSPASAVPNTWISVGSGFAANVSGIAPADTGWVIVRDNKKAWQNHVALLDQDGDVTPLAWPGSPPADLESVDAIPGSADGYVVVNSAGTGWVLSIQGAAITVDRQFSLPGDLRQVEGFALTSVDGSTVAVWASRGSSTRPARVKAATFDPQTTTFGPLRSGKVSVPYPTSHARQVSSMTISDGRVLVSSASDPGNEGPFSSGVFDVGTIPRIWKSGKPALKLATPVEIGRYDGHKVEGIACGHGVGILGSDDEKLGGAVRTADICPGDDDPPGGGGTSMLADWEMNEGQGASVMSDASGNGITGSIGKDVKTGRVIQGETAYKFPWARPNKTPADTPRLVRVNDDRLNPGTSDFSITLRYRTTHNFGNILQKGQHGARGGYFKLEQPKGHLTCLFRGVDGHVLVNSGVQLDDGAWHTVVCSRTGNKVTMTIDDQITHTKTGTIGSISNNVPLTIGGKTNCNQVTITCDFFVGDIDKVQIEKS